MGTSVNNTEQRRLLLRQKQDGLRQDATANQSAVQQNASAQQTNTQDVQTNTQAQQSSAAAVQTTAGNIQGVEQSISVNETSISGVNTELQNIRTEMAAAHDDPERLAGLQDEYDLAQVSMEQLEQQSQTLQTNHKQLQTQKTQQEQTLAGLEQTGTQLSADGETLVQEGVTLQKTGEDLNSQISELDSEIAQAEEQELEIESELPEFDIIKGKDGSTTTNIIDPKTGKIIESTVTDANGQVIKKEELIDPTNSNSKRITEVKDGVTTVTERDGKNVTSRVAVSENGNVAEYDGQGHTLLTVKAGESPDGIYNKFYGQGEANAANREALVEQFRQRAIVGGKPVAADYNPSEDELKRYFYAVAGLKEVYTESDRLKQETYRRSVQGLTFTSEEALPYYDRDVRLKNGGVLQAGQTLKLPTEIHPDNVNLQNRDAAVEKARGNEAESNRLAIIQASKLGAAHEEESVRAFKAALIEDIQRNAGVGLYASCGHPSGDYVSGVYDKKMKEQAGALDADSSDFGDITYHVRRATGSERFAGGEDAQAGTLSVKLTEEKLNQLYDDIQVLARNSQNPELKDSPETKALKQSVQERWNEYTMRNFVKDYNYKSAESDALNNLLLTFMFDAVTAFTPGESDVLKTWNTVEEGTKYASSFMSATSSSMSGAMSAAEGNSAGMQALDMALSFIPGASTLKAVFTYEVKSDVCQRLGNSTTKIKAFSDALSKLSGKEQEELANLLKGKSSEVQAKILEEYANGRKGYSR